MSIHGHIFAFSKAITCTIYVKARPTISINLASSKCKETWASEACYAGNSICLTSSQVGLAFDVSGSSKRSICTFPDSTIICIPYTGLLNINCLSCFTYNFSTISTARCHSDTTWSCSCTGRNNCLTLIMNCQSGR